MIIKCPTCGHQMEAVELKDKGCGFVLVSLILFVVGMFLFIGVPFIGWVLGPLICIYALFRGFTGRKVWKCEHCQTIIERG